MANWIVYGARMAQQKFDAFIGFVWAVSVLWGVWICAIRLSEARTLLRCIIDPDEKARYLHAVQQPTPWYAHVVKAATIVALFVLLAVVALVIVGNAR